MSVSETGQPHGFLRQVLNARPWKRIAINLFLAFHILAIAGWCLPWNSLLAERFRVAIRPYMIWSGLFQAWDTFAPTPRSVNAYIEGTVILRDGQIRTWKFPRMEKLGFLERYYRERYRKFSENLPLERNAALWPEAGRYLARLHYDPANPPEIVMLIQYWSDIVIQPNGTFQQGPLRAHVFWEHRFTPEDLR
jgi:hypothetical protein